MFNLLVQLITRSGRTTRVIYDCMHFSFFIFCFHVVKAITSFPARSRDKNGSNFEKTEHFLFLLLPTCVYF